MSEEADARLHIAPLADAIEESDGLYVRIRAIGSHATHLVIRDWVEDGYWVDDQSIHLRCRTFRFRTRDGVIKSERYVRVDELITAIPHAHSADRPSLRGVEKRLRRLADKFGPGPDAYVPGALANMLDMSSASINKFAKDAGQPTPNQGGHRFTWTLGQAIKIIDRAAMTARSNRNRQKAIEKLAELTRRAENHRQL